MKGKNRTIMLKAKQERKSQMASDKKKKKLSRYGRKHAYLAKNNLWGFEVPSPKPWGSKN